MKLSVAALAVIAIVMLGLSSCGSSTPGARPEQPPKGYQGQKHVDVDAQGNLFTPPNIIIDVGATVTWHNKDAVAHNVKKLIEALDYGGKFGVDTDKFGPGTSYSFTFTTAGRFFYTCTVHSLMSGTVLVLAPQATTTTGARATTTTTTG